MSNFHKLINENKPVLVDFYATWCGPCKMMTPILDDLKSRIGDKAHILKVDVDKNQKIANKLGVRGVPTIVLYKNGQIKWRASGVRQANELQRVIEQYA